MKARDFCYWLQGYFEIHGNQPYPGEPHKRWNLNDSQIDSIVNHLKMVFHHDIDPSFGDKKEQDELNKIHTRPPKDTLIRC